MSSSNAWTPNWGAIPHKARANVNALAFYCLDTPSVLANLAVRRTVCQFLLPRVTFPSDLANHDELMAHIGLGPDAHIDDIQADPNASLKVIVAFATTPPSMWGADEADPTSACCNWPYELTAVRLLARAITRAVAA
ncbi:MAG: hypothetical protein Q7V62_00115 [Actinomycetota bacterium]|nr:hypothetical protein [Actinomycetota bacterium]